MNTHTILIVDDERINREILGHLLESDYSILKAENGQLALDIMKEKPYDIAAVILDLVMPVMGGYEVLSEMMADEKLSKIPVIVSSQETGMDSEIKALSLGAQDFIGKPYKADLIKQRLANTIRLRETAAIANRAERDELTGLYNKQFFIEKVEEQLRENPNKNFCLISFGVERFKLINDAFGMKKGDAFLKHIADVVKADLQNHNICGRFNADWFYILIDNKELLTENEFKNQIDKINDFEIDMKVKLHIGIYEIDDREDSVAHMCDLAKLASQKNHGNYDKIFTFYDESMRKALIEEQFITNSMNKAIQEREFVVYYQPKYDLHTEAVIGAEALVRWIHPERGFLSPGSFIPIFEKNGFITELDRYVWETVCLDLKGWIDRGISPVPVSINVSRADIFNPNLAGIITGLLEKYNIPIQYLHLEITESAYTDNPEQIIDTVRLLHDMGFIIEMDDFGSGYSSLNMLAELPVDILKLDMGFVQSEGKNSSGKGIMSFVISMAKWMQLSVIAEGVENEDQIMALRSMDCNFVQGFYYSKPIPKVDFEKIITTVVISSPEEQNISFVEQTSNVYEELKDHVMLIVDDIDINRDVLSSFFFDKFEIVEASNGQEAIDYLRGNYDKVEIVLLDLIMPIMDGFQTLKKMRAEQSLKAIPVIVTSQGDIKAEQSALDLGADDFISKPYNPQIVEKRVANLVGINHARQDAALELNEVRKKEQTLMDSIPGGVAIYHVKKNHSITIDYVSDGFAKLLGYGADEYLKLFKDDAKANVAPEDIPRLSKAAQDAIEENASINEYQHIFKKDKSKVMVRLDANVITEELDEDDAAVLYAVHTAVPDKSESVIEEQNRYRFILDNLDVAYFEYDSDGEFYSSDKYSLYGMSDEDPTEIIGSGVGAHENVHPDDLPILFDFLSLKSKNLSTISKVLRLRMKDGSFRWTEMMGFFEYDQDGNKLKSIGVLRDVDKEWLNQNRKLQTALDDAKHANDAKTDFLARVSHDMRTPINGILGLISLIEEKETDPNLLGDVEKMKQSGEYLCNLINDTLDVSAVEHGKLELSPTICDGKTAFNNVISMIMPNIAEKNIDFKMEAENLPFTKLYIDIGRVQQAIINILSNAVKFTPEGGTIIFKMENLSVKDGVITDKITITDNGIGMSEEFLPRIFEPFAQEHNDRKTKYNGTGLGMTIAKQCIELMGGDIKVTSTQGEGTTVSILLPMAIATEAQISKANDEAIDDKIKKLQGKRILLCEDHPLNAEIAIKLLEKKGIKVVPAENGKVGVDLFKSSSIGYFHTILMDIRMPVMDGLEATRAIRRLNREDAQSVPIIALTANAMTSDVRDSLNSGMNAHIGKPVVPAALYKTIAEVIDSAGIHQDKRILIVDDIEMNRSFIKRVVSGHYDVVEAGTGLEALEILKKDNDIAAVITDIQMPVMDGKELIKTIRANSEYDKIAILANTIYGDHKQEEELIDLGANDFVYKPASPQVLLLRLEHILRNM